MIEQIHNTENLGFARGYNTGMKHAMDSGADFIFIINNDATVAPETISNLIQYSTPNKRHHRAIDQLLEIPKYDLVLRGNNQFLDP